jgi:hypothetical protein
MNGFRLHSLDKEKPGPSSVRAFFFAAATGASDSVPDGSFQSGGSWHNG